MHFNTLNYYSLEHYSVGQQASNHILFLQNERFFLFLKKHSEMNQRLKKLVQKAGTKPEVLDEGNYTVRREEYCL